MVEKSVSLPKINPWLILIAVGLPTFVDAFNSSVANVALRYIAGSYSITNDESLWIITSFLISCSILLPASAWFSSIFGRKNFFLGCIFVFGLATIGCGLAPNFQCMILARVVQGLAGGPIFPLAQAIILESFPKNEHGKAMAAFGTAVVLAPILGPVFGGYVTVTYVWNWVFFMTVPFLILSLILINMWVKDPDYIKSSTPLKFDIAGFIMLIIWLNSKYKS